MIRISELKLPLDHAPEALVHPGPVQTDMLTGDAKVPLDIFAQLIPLKRLGQPREIGEVVAFLAGDGASFVTGAEIFVDGGMTISMT